MKWLPGGPNRSVRSQLAIILTLALVASLTVIVPALADHPEDSGFSIDGSVPDAGSVMFGDLAGNNKELGPANSNTTKLGVIHNDALPTLGLSNPNGQVDLVNVWFDTNTAEGKDWLYFAWQRDATNGSGVIAIEFQENAAPTACDYENSTQEQLIAGCNPWANRQDGDFLLIWDQVGNDIVISIRFFDGTAFGPVIPLDEHQFAATLNGDTSRGEAVVDLSVVFGEGEPTECVSIGNIIPGTITGNSDTADYKDTVLADITDFITISNCGSLTLTKTDDDDPAEALQGAVFTLYESDGDDDFEPGTDDPIAQDPDGVDQTCTTTASGVCTITDIFFGEYWIDETTVPEGHDKASGLPQLVTISSTTQVDLGTFVNPRKTGSILVEKVDESDLRLDGASFELDADGSLETTDDRTPIPGVTGEDGLFCIDGLLFDEYTVVETAAPDGYEAATDSQTFEVDTASTCDERTGDPIDDPDLTFVNNRLPGAIVITKNAKDFTADSGESPLEGVTFTVYDSDENVAGSDTTDADGKACVDGLTVGETYTVTETDVPDGFAVDSNVTQDVLVTDDATCETPDDADSAGPFSNDPLSEIEVIFRSLAGDRTAATIDCEDADTNALTATEEDTTPDDFDDADETFTNLVEGTYTCTVVIDP